MSGHLWLDVTVLVTYFVVIIGIGLSQRSKSGSVEGFALGDRQTPWWAVLASILAAEISAATFLGAPESGFVKGNWTYAQFAIGTIIARIVVSYLFIPLFYAHGVISLYEYLETRFGPRTRTWASATFLVTRVLAMGTRLYVSAIILVLAWQLFRGVPVQAWEKFWIFAGAVLLVTLLTALYTAVGGIRAVIWTDFIQVGVLVAALGFSVYALLGRIPGGWSTATQHFQEPLFWNFAKPAAEPGAWAWIKNVLTSEYTIWAAVIGSTFVTMSTHGIDQDTVQRMLTAKNRKESARATILSGFLDLPVVGCFILVGILVSVFYKTGIGTLPEGIVGREAFPYFILTEMPAGMRGLVIAGIMATAMGSLSTALNALGTSFARDFVLPRREARGPVTEDERVRVLRWSTVLFAGLIILVGLATSYYMAHNPTAAIIPLVLGILGFTFGSLLGIFLLAVLTRHRGSDLGNVIAMISGFVVVVFFSSGDLQRLVGFVTAGANGVMEPALVLAFPWRITLGTLVTVGVAACFKTAAGRDQAVQDSVATHA
ncbi:MAG: sodium solute transporter superfamily [Chthoniobacter sp.]|jgi:SSS family solute:Na+ symporter|nr:sodium solute transporter superfamily [Chthoniobacter sp.]